MSATGQGILIIILIVINTIVALAYYFINAILNKNREKSIWIRSVIMLICPIVGPLFIFVSYFVFRVFMSEPVDLADVIFSKERIKFEAKADEERERNMIPLEEAIVVAGKQELRGLVLNVVSNNSKGKLSSLMLALNSEDSETSHYAASVLQDALNDFRGVVEVQYRKVLDGDENRVEICEQLMDYMNDFLGQHVFIEMEQKNYVNIMEEVCEIFYVNSRWKMSCTQFEAICLRLLEIEEFGKCEKWCMRSKEQYPDMLTTYTCMLKLYFNSRQKEKFFSTMDELKKSAIVIDSDTLEMIRVFSAQGSPRNN